VQGEHLIWRRDEDRALIHACTALKADGGDGGLEIEFSTVLDDVGRHDACAPRAKVGAAGGEAQPECAQTFVRVHLSKRELRCRRLGAMHVALGHASTHGTAGVGTLLEAARELVVCGAARGRAGEERLLVQA
jgi:hypothetical protein